MTLGKDQVDTDDEKVGCKLRADEGLDAISSLAPGSLGSNLLVGGTNTVYAWLIQWLADNLGLCSIMNDSWILNTDALSNTRSCFIQDMIPQVLWLSHMIGD
jgi:hypothetical protein